MEYGRGDEEEIKRERETKIIGGAVREREGVREKEEIMMRGEEEKKKRDNHPTFHLRAGC